MIIVSNKHYFKKETGDNVIYIGRPTPLGNPFSHRAGTLAKFVTKSVDEAIAKYEQWLVDKIESEDKDVLRELHKIVDASKNDKRTVLLCWCYPKPCHANIVKKIIEERYIGEAK